MSLKRKMRRASVALLAVLLALLSCLLFGCGGSKGNNGYDIRYDETAVRLKTITLTVEKTDLLVGQELRMSVTIDPTDAVAVYNGQFNDSFDQRNIHYYLVLIYIIDSATLVVLHKAVYLFLIKLHCFTKHRHKLIGIRF